LPGQQEPKQHEARQSAGPAQAKAPGRGCGSESRLGDQARFIRTWVEKPLVIGAVSPSGRDLARTMASAVDLDDKGPIIELGPGTGVVTEALLDRGIAPGRLILLEYDKDFCTLLAQRYPGVRVVQGDAYALASQVAGIVDEPVAAVVSSLPLLTKPEQQRLNLLKEAFDLMGPGGRFVQFTYSIGSPMPRDNQPVAVTAEVSPRIWRNVPPARVWVYRRADAQSPTRVFRAGASGVDRFEQQAEKLYLGLKKEFKGANGRKRGAPPRASDPK
jgi:phosphatidylethanolamine/phosphatidyl-N-methylethanolamine N-methyltransferase